MPHAMNEVQLAQALALILDSFEGTAAHKRLHNRLRDLGSNVRDEVVQFRQLQKAVRESPELRQALEALGYGDLATLDTVRPDERTGLVIQAFNRMVEEQWDSGPKRR